MSFFSRFFRKAQSTTITPGRPDARRHSNAEPAGVATTSAADQQRAATSLPYGDALLSLASSAPSAAQKAAQQRLAQMLDAGSVDIPRLGAQLDNRTALLSIAALASDPAHLQQAVSAVSDTDFWFHLVTEGPSTKLRQLAAEQVEDPAQLKRLLKDARGKDKNAYKIVRRKCDLILAHEKQLADRQAAVVALCEAIERHSHKPFDGAFIATLEHLSAQWGALGAQAPAELRPRVDSAIERSREVISNHLRIVGAEAARATAIENADPQRQAILDEMRQSLAAAYAMELGTPDAAAQTAQQVAKWTERWEGTARHKATSSADVAAFDRLRAALLRAVQLSTEHGTLRQQLAAIRSAPPEQDLRVNYQALQATLAAASSLSDTEWPEEVSAAAAAIKDWEKRRSDEQAAAAAALRQVGGLIRKANNAISDGRSSQAAGVRRALAAALLELPSVPGYISGQIEQLDKRLNELQDWKSFAVAPKRAQLIETMEALIGVPADPVELADQIKRLQDEWKSITRGSAEQNEADWQRFQQAAQTAYQPCREYFTAQAKLRQENLERRRTLLARLAAFDSSHDWANADWKEVAKVLRNARQEWRSCSPTDRVATKPVQLEFEALLKGMQDRLDAEYANNVGRKQSLIQQVKRLLGEADTRQAIADVKRLQAAWKTAGLVPHLQDQQLWEEFRQQCDAVYRRSQEEYSKFVGELESNKDRALALCAQVEEVAGLATPELSAAAQQVRQLRAEFEAIGELPRADASEVQRRFDRAVEQYERNVARQQALHEQQKWNNLFAASNAVRLLQLAALTEPAADLQAQRQSVRSMIDGVQQWPKGGRQAIERKLGAAGSTDRAANQAALRDLCIRAEILTQTQTPAADQALRRDYQLQTLVQGLGQPTGRAGEQLEALVFEWVGVGATTTDVYYELLERFNQCWVKAQADSR